MSDSKGFLLKAFAILAILALPGNFVTLYFVQNKGPNPVNNDTLNISEPVIHREEKPLPASK